jgi:hypothetical protein
MNCKKCNHPATVGQALCDECLNSWLIMRDIIKQRLTAQYGEPTRETLSIQQNEMKRLENIWKRDREQFKKEVNTWYNHTPTP